MPSLTIEYTTDAERLVLEQALAYFAQMRQVAATAPDRTVLSACEQLALSADDSCCVTAWPRRCKAASTALAPKKVSGTHSKGQRSRWVLTAVGRIRLSR